MGVILVNNLFTTLTAPLSDTDTTMTVVPDDAELFPPVGGEDYTYATISAPGATGVPPLIEIVKVTDRMGDVLTIERGVDNTMAHVFPDGAQVALRVNAASVMDAFPTNNDFLRL